MALLMLIPCIGIICACSGIIKLYVEAGENCNDPVEKGAILFFEIFFGSIIIFCILVAGVILEVGTRGY